MAILFSDPYDLKLDVNGDLDLTGGDASFTTGTDAVKQQLQRTLNLFRGEWFLDLDRGVPWFEEILGKPYVEAKAHAVFRAAILTEYPDATIVDLSTVFVGETRELTVSWIVQPVFGDTDPDTARNATISGFFTSSV